MSRRGVQTSAWRPSICIGAVISSIGNFEVGAATRADCCASAGEFNLGFGGRFADGDFFFLIDGAGAVVVGYAHFVNATSGDVKSSIGFACHYTAVFEPLITDARAWQWVGSCDVGREGVRRGVESVNVLAISVGEDFAQHEGGQCIDGYRNGLAVGGIGTARLGSGSSDGVDICACCIRCYSVYMVGIGSDKATVL